MGKVQEMIIAAKLLRKSDDELNNILFELHTRYKILDNDWMTIMASAGIITQRQIIEQMGKKNDLSIDGGSSAGTV